jgi:hypothetical protein
MAGIVETKKNTNLLLGTMMEIDHVKAFVPSKSYLQVSLPTNVTLIHQKVILHLGSNSNSERETNNKSSYNRGKRKMIGSTGDLKGGPIRTVINRWFPQNKNFLRKLKLHFINSDSSQQGSII